MPTLCQQRNHMRCLSTLKRVAHAVPTPLVAPRPGKAVSGDAHAGAEWIKATEPRLGNTKCLEDLNFQKQEMTVGILTIAVQLQKLL